MGSHLISKSKNALRHSRDAFRYHYHMKNGLRVWWSQKRKTPIPPLQMRDGYSLHHGPYDEPISLFQEIYIDKFYEVLDAPPNANVIDIGANIGAVTLYWSRSRPDITFHAYEPNPQSYDALRMNVEANGLSSQVLTYAEAIGGERGTLDLWTNVPTTLSTAYGAAPADGALKQQAPMITLDEAWSRMGRLPVWMLKIDTEGAEVDILENASDAMLASVETACIEWHDNLFPGAFERCSKRLNDAGFIFHTRAHPWNEGIIFARKNVLEL